MSELPVVSGRAVVKALAGVGFEIDRPRGSHIILRQSQPLIEESSCLTTRINELADDPRPAGAVKLAGAEDLWRARVGEYRMGYQVRDVLLQVLVVLVGHRGDIYRRLRDL